PHKQSGTAKGGGRISGCARNGNGSRKCCGSGGLGGRIISAPTDVRVCGQSPEVLTLRVLGQSTEVLTFKGADRGGIVVVTV
ncbi:MAG: hypothetical protein RR873_07195, partial [Christensenella sp.]